MKWKTESDDGRMVSKEGGNSPVPPKLSGSSNSSNNQIPEYLRIKINLFEIRNYRWP